MSKKGIICTHGGEFDETKSRGNLDKHGIDFIAAQGLWKDPYLLALRAISEDEQRCWLIGKIGEKRWSAIVIYREARIRLISVRRSREKEVRLYES